MRKKAPSKADSAGKVSFPRRVVLLAVPPAMELDIFGPMSVFAAANRLGGPYYTTELITTASDGAVAGTLGLSISAHGRYEELRGPVDTLLVVGGTGVLSGCDPAVVVWLREMAAKVRRLGSVCTGAFLLAEAGVLDGRKATTHWAWTQALASRYPGVTVDPNPIWVQSGNVYTSAGVTAGMDLALAFVEEDCGSEAALFVARDLVLFLRRPGGQSQFSASLAAQATERKAILELQIWMAEHLGERITVEQLAERAAMSPRNFARVFVRELGVTPARYVERLRLEAARHDLERTDKSLSEIAAVCGFGSAESMRRAFYRTLGITPGSYRDHFGAS
ncbi:MAG: HTH-type transcriptional regulator CdhR [Syntrophaceae bacterium PtaU1.Bin231]|nr:MAG: HTH-type transcriptional regulator CdhR [Syntrophaceae bacterium PtaU1.Bin231]